MSWGTIWGIWLAVVGVSFGVLEGIGLSIRNKTGTGLPPNDSLSETSWRWLHVVPGQGVEHWTLPHVLAAIFLLGMCVVLIGHIALGLWR